MSTNSDEPARRLVHDLSHRLTMLQAVHTDSAPGMYLALTRSGTIYIMDLTDADRPPVLTRHPARETLLHDGEPLPAVHAFAFEVGTGIGDIIWWKQDPAHYERPDLPYIGTRRASSRVLLVARINDPSTTKTTYAIQLFRDLLAAISDPNLEYASLVDSLSERPA